MQLPLDLRYRSDWRLAAALGATPQIRRAHPSGDEPAAAGSPELLAASGGQPDLTVAVDAARRGDDAAFAFLYRSVQPGLLRYLRAIVGSDAEDVASEAWLQIARDLRSYRGNGSGFRAWAASIARNRAMDHLRHHRRRPAITVPAEELAEFAARHETADQAVETLSTNAAIAFIASLPRDQAEAILLRVVVGLDARAAASVLGKRAGAVRTSAWRGLRRLAEQLHEGGAGASRDDIGRVPARRRRPGEPR